MDPANKPIFVLSVETFVFAYGFRQSLVRLFGIISAVNLFRYADHVPGKIYKSLLKDVLKGLIFVYAVLILAIAGFQYIFRGASKLQTIEETI